MPGISFLNLVMTAWAVVTFILAGLLIYRSILSMKEDDQLFLDSAEANLEREQQQVISRLQRLAPYTKALTASSIVLLVAGGGLWVYEQFTKSALP